MPSIKGIYPLARAFLRGQSSQFGSELPSLRLRVGAFGTLYSKVGQYTGLSNQRGTLYLGDGEAKNTFTPSEKRFENLIDRMTVGSFGYSWETLWDKVNGGQYWLARQEIKLKTPLDELDFKVIRLIHDQFFKGRNTGELEKYYQILEEYYNSLLASVKKGQPLNLEEHRSLLSHMFVYATVVMASDRAGPETASNTFRLIMKGTEESIMLCQRKGDIAPNELLYMYAWASGNLPVALYLDGKFESSVATSLSHDFRVRELNTSSADRVLLHSISTLNKTNREIFSTQEQQSTLESPKQTPFPFIR